MYAKIGRITPSSSGVNNLRADYLGGLICSTAGDYKDAMLAGRIYFAFCQSQNVAVFSATAAIGLQVWNPPTSGVNLVVHKWACQVWATSAGMTGLMLAVATQPTVPGTTTTATLTGKALVTGTTGLSAGACTAYSVATILTPVAVWPLFHNTVAIAITGAEKMEGDLQGSFSFAPGTCVVLGALGAAGVTVNLGLTWEEVPVGM
jgi:hypothetical protein